MEGGILSDTPEIDAAELYYDGPTGFVPIEVARKVESKLNEALKENARLRPALMGFSQANSPPATTTAPGHASLWTHC